MRLSLVLSGVIVLALGLFLVILSLPNVKMNYQVSYQATDREINKFFFGGATPSFTMDPNGVYSSSAWQMHPNYTDIYFAFITDKSLDIYIYDSVELLKWEDGKPATPVLVETRLGAGNYSYPISNNAYGVVIENNNPSSAYVQNFTFGESREIQVTKYRTEYRDDYTMVMLGSIVGIVGFIIMTLGIAIKPKVSSQQKQVPAPLRMRSASTYYCRYCGSENKSDAMFCQKCGKKLSES